MPCPPGLFEQQREGALLLPPRRQLVPHGTRARDQCDQSEALLQAQAQRAFTRGFTVGDEAVHPVEAERPTLLDGHRGLAAVTGIAIAPTQAEREPVPAHAETQEHLFESVPPILAVPIGWTRRARAWAWAGLLRLGPLQRHGRRILMEPGCRNAIHLQGVERARTKDTVESRGTQCIEDLPQPVSMERGACEAGLEQGEQPTLLQASPYLIKGMMAIEHRQQEGLHATAAREDMRRVRRTESIDERSHVKLADDPEHHRQVSHRTAVMNRNRHDATPLPVVSELPS
jgi:hypothetical protein